MPKKRTEQDAVPLEAEAEQATRTPEATSETVGQAIARANIERALADRRTASAEGYVQVYLEKGVLTQAEAEGYLAEIHRQRYGGAT
jgi:type II secretory pathway component PulM